MRQLKTGKVQLLQNLHKLKCFRIQLSQNLRQFNEKEIARSSVRTSKNFHDRFLIIDDKVLYLIGASLKDLGWKCFAFTKLAAAEIPNLKARV